MDMAKYYTNEKTAQVVIALLKAHGIKKVIASPGTTNVAFVGSIQKDPYFEKYSCVDERSAAYMACGLAAESGEPVVLSCTGATAARNYPSGLTEAYYRKLPVLAITSSQAISRVGHHIAQVTDRSTIQNDIARLSVSLPLIKDEDDFWECEVQTNKAILELTRHGGGPVHINLPTRYDLGYDTEKLPDIRMIQRITLASDFPELPSGKVAVFIGAHKKMSQAETDMIDAFCTSNGAVVFCDHTSGYRGKYHVQYSLVAGQQFFKLEEERPVLLIHIGEISGDYYSLKLAGSQVWRVSQDGEIRDTFKKLNYVFEMPEGDFFKYYTTDIQKKNTYLQSCRRHLDDVRGSVPELPFSNLWIASKMAPRVPVGSVIHFGILNSLRSWNFYELPEGVDSACNVGGFGIDGCLSALLGASLSNRERLYFGIVGDLATFYDLNALGNRHIGNNVRILIVNNGRGTEFRNYNHPAARFGSDADEFMAAAGHFGNKSSALIKNFSENLGFEYLCASDKESFSSVCDRFLTNEVTSRPMLLEVFTSSEEESNALEKMLTIEKGSSKDQAKQAIKRVLGRRSIDALKKVVRS
jgi:2-succinyl-5-enolpyruvyl-6-hydroxy-3-cyclohexene-1-carboxylate synthase